jgi:hypothetical protein
MSRAVIYLIQFQTFTFSDVCNCENATHTIRATVIGEKQIHFCLKKSEEQEGENIFCGKTGLREHGYRI